jgi:hypothetical protein
MIDDHVFHRGPNIMYNYYRSWEFGIWNLDHYLPAEFRMQIHTEFRANFTVKIPRNSAEFRGIPYVFQKIPYSAGSKKITSVDTLATRRGTTGGQNAVQGGTGKNTGCAGSSRIRQEAGHRRGCFRRCSISQAGWSTDAGL